MADRLPPDEWLGAAKSLHVGQKRRVRHTCGRTASMDVYNHADSWSAYCFRCKESGRVTKAHQSVRVAQEDTSRTSPVPATAIHISQASQYVQKRIWEFLISKGCPPGIIPENMLWYIPEVQRLLIRQGTTAFGRALNVEQLPKWLRYGDYSTQSQLFWTRYQGAEETAPVVLVEDCLSALKVAKAISIYAPESSIDVTGTSGTSLNPASLKTLMGRDVICMYDGDPAGEQGSRALRRRLAVFGGAYSDRRPAGCDPKDLSLENIYETLKEFL